jgi:AraC-like DNA-binding protein/quercetin dioxygenase-like cupin family protein
MGMADWIENITDSCIISKGCRERFLPLDGDYARPLVERGVNFSGVSDLRARYEIARRRPPFHLVIATLGGEGRFRVAAAEGTLRPGDLWVVPAGTPQQYGTDGEWRILFFHISPSSSGGTIPFTKPTIIAASISAQLESAMNWYSSELLRGGARSHDLARAYAEVVRVCLDRSLEASDLPERSRIRIRLDELWEAINGNIGRNWTVDEMARRVKLSVSQFRRVVLAQHGRSPQDMLLDMRIGRAQQLLARTDDKLSVIAERVGYESPFSLSRAFRRTVGISPREYRNRVNPLPPRDEFDDDPGSQGRNTGTGDPSVDSDEGIEKRSEERSRRITFRSARGLAPSRIPAIRE